MFDFQTEKVISLREAARMMPSCRQGKALHHLTVHRWIFKGVDGVQLEGARLGGQWVTSREALARFSEALTVKRTLPRLNEDKPVGRPEKARKRKDEGTERDLRKYGL
jgi:hypothetical protein